MFSKIFGSSKKDEEPKAQTTENNTVPVEENAEAKSDVRKLPNGLINGEQLEYTLDHTFDGTAVVLTFSAGPGLESVMAFPTPHEPAAVPMINTGELWTAELTGHQEGEELQVHFVVVSNGQQADNENAKDKLVVKPATRKPETEPAAAPEAAAAAEAVAPAEPLLVAEPAPASESAPSPDPNPTFEHKMPNGLIDGKPLEYSVEHKFDGAVLSLMFAAGPGLTSVLAFPTPHEPAAVHMTNEGDVWKADLEAYKDGDEFHVHFVAAKDGHQADNVEARHIVKVGGGADE
mmetsp:Transcript_12976/g.23622  ORF Transcript_12976/g.23622 Transcript_12976/m.23622 type:complete len:290 (+) Transcript_12976:60-929(+)